MRHRPFLSHKRQRARTVAYLKQQLCIRGGGGWKDTDDIPLGVDFLADCKKAIEHETGGFIWWGTKDTLGSPIICATELPTALDRAERDPGYPVVPVLVDLKPGRDSSAIEAAIGPAYAKRLLNTNGILQRNGQSLRELARETARRYVAQLVRGLPAGPVDVAITAFRAPTEQHDLTLDWRSLFNPKSRELVPGAQETIVEALSDIRAALQARERSPGGDGAHGQSRHRADADGRARRPAFGACAGGALGRCSGPRAFRSRYVGRHTSWCDGGALRRRARRMRLRGDACRPRCRRGPSRCR